uniref:T-complex protein 1 subunit gamma n=1 Tax=Meleagris gallopavo TaxID=9103 RepID=H9H0X6_MELGA
MLWERGDPNPNRLPPPTAGEMLSVAEHFLEQQMHPTVIIGAYRKALDDMIHVLKKISTPVDVNNREMMLKIIKSAINTKAINRWSELACSIALDAVRTVELEENGRKEIDIKKYAKVEKIPGGFSEDSCVLRGIMVNKDVTHPRMRRLIKNPRIVLLDCSLEYKKGESQTDIEITREEDFARILQMEEEYIQQICEDLLRVKPDLVITEKGISDLAQHYLMRANISAVRRVRKTDNNRIARACGARIVSRTDELREEDVGTGAGLFEVKKIGDEYFAFITDCKDPKACTIVLRGASKEILAEVERNLQDAMQVCRNVLVDPQLVPGGGAAEMAVSHALTEKSKGMTGVEQWPYRAVAQALEVIPRTLIQNCGASTIRVLTSLRAKHTQEGSQTWGVNGESGALADMKELGVWEPLAVKLQTYKTAVEVSMQYNPGWNGSSVNVLHVRSVGRGDSLHYVWSSIGAPAVLLVATRSPSSALSIDWSRLLSPAPAGAVWIEPPGSVVYAAAVVFTKLFEYSKADASEEVFYPTYDLSDFSWDSINRTVNHTALTAELRGVPTSDPSGSFSNGSLAFRVTAYESGGRDGALPGLLHTANSSKVEFVLAGAAPRGNGSRFVLEVAAVEGRGAASRLRSTRSIDDEYTPTIFETLSLVAESRNDSSALSFLQWKATAYGSQ